MFLCIMMISRQHDVSPLKSMKLFMAGEISKSSIYRGLIFSLFDKKKKTQLLACPLKENQYEYTLWSSVGWIDLKSIWRSDLWGETRNFLFSLCWLVILNIRVLKKMPSYLNRQLCFQSLENFTMTNLY